jgi:tRNA threonylcarbamoyladenosine biosynthesis protein TsaE
MRTFTIAHERDTARMAAALIPLLQGGRMIGLSGDLGAGKTTFVRYLVAAAGGDTRAVSSPTYTLEHEYHLPQGLVIEHWDLYRLTALPLELEERTPSSVIRIIEWPERCPDILPSLFCHLRLLRRDQEEGSEDRVLEVRGEQESVVISLLDGVLGNS